MRREGGKWDDQIAQLFYIDGVEDDSIILNKLLRNFRAAPL